MQDFAFDVPHIQVKPGTTVTWTNRDDDQHDVLFFDGTRGPMLNQTQTYQWTFAEPGVYQYVCSAHAQMRGKVTVADDQTALANDE